VVTTSLFTVRLGVEGGSLCPADSVGIAPRIVYLQRWRGGIHLGIDLRFGDAVWAHGLGKRGVAFYGLAARCTKTKLSGCPATVPASDFFRLAIELGSEGADRVACRCHHGQPAFRRRRGADAIRDSPLAPHRGVGIFWGRRGIGRPLGLRPIETCGRTQLGADHISLAGPHSGSARSGQARTLRS
jgi:hypothetical protein